jgi:cyclophilin family peptidyl-prolyl cis-trans isomerase
VQVHPSSQSPGHYAYEPDDLRRKLRLMADRLHARGARVLLQLMHFGAEFRSDGNDDLTPLWSFGGTTSPSGSEVAHRMTADEVEEVADAFVRTAALAIVQEALKDRVRAVRVRAGELLQEQNVPAAATAEASRQAPTGRPMDDAERQALLSPAFSPHAYIETDRGTIEIELAILDAPLTVANFIALARKDFYDGVAIHRVVADFVVQDGDPRGDGEGGPGYTIRDEINERPYLRGTVGMALDWQDTGGSQFFITHSPQPHLDGRYTVFGHVVDGMNVVDAIQPWDIVRRVTVRDGTPGTD